MWEKKVPKSDGYVYNVQPIKGTTEGTIQIPPQIVIDDGIVRTIFGGNDEALKLNCEVIRKPPGKRPIYYSADIVVQDDQSDERNFYPAEFLNTLSFPGMSPHQLTLKKRTIVMLLRNLNPKEGL